MKKIFVIDTNVLLFDADSIFKFGDNDVVIPITVIEELDTFKKNVDDLGRNARRVSRHLDELRKKGTLVEGATLPGGGTLVVKLYDARMELPSFDMNVPDNRILSVATWAVSVTAPDVDVVLITKDVNLRIKADSIGLATEDYENSKVDSETLYSGCSVIDVDHVVVELLYSGENVGLEQVGGEKFPPNHCVTVRSRDNVKQAVLCRYNAVMNRLERLPQDLSPSGLKARSAEQQFAMDLLCDPSVELVTLVGLAGSGKTLMAIASGLHGVLEDKIYKKLLLLKPTMAMDNSNDLGFLPGSIEEKLAPWIQSYNDNLDYLMSENKPEIPKAAASKRKSIRVEKAVAKFDDEKGAGKISFSEELTSRGFIEIGSLSHLRGRSLPNQYLIVDEAQNLSPAALKTVISRAGEGSKVVLIGDVRQIDNPYLSADTNGLVFVIDRFVKEDISGHLTLLKSERSRLAERAAELL